MAYNLMTDHEVNTFLRLIQLDLGRSPPPESTAAHMSLQFGL